MRIATEATTGWRDHWVAVEILSERIAILSFRIACRVNSDPTRLAVLPPPKIRLCIPKRLSAAVEDLKGKVGALARIFLYFRLEDPEKKKRRRRGLRVKFGRNPALGRTTTALRRFVVKKQRNHTRLPVGLTSAGWSAPSSLRRSINCRSVRW